MFFPPDLVPNGPHIETKKALLLIDLQHDFVSPKGHLPVPNVLQFLPKIPQLVTRFRTKGEVVWVHSEYHGPRSNISPSGGFNIVLKQHLKSFEPQAEHDGSISRAASERSEEEPMASNTELGFQRYPSDPDAEAFLAETLPGEQRRCCLLGSKGAQYPSRLLAHIDPGRDITIAKSEYSALNDMSLLMQLRTRLVTDLYVCGSLSNISVHATVLDAVRNGFSVFLVEDCLGFRDEACHFEAMRQMADMMGANGTDYQELMDDLSGMLGDVIRLSDLPRTFEISVQPTSRSELRTTSSRKVQDWIKSFEDDSKHESKGNRQSVPISQNVQDDSVECHAQNLARKGNMSHKDRQDLPGSITSLKRSSSDRDEPEHHHRPRHSQYIPRAPDDCQYYRLDFSPSPQHVAESRDNTTEPPHLAEPSPQPPAIQTSDASRQPSISASERRVFPSSMSQPDASPTGIVSETIKPRPKKVKKVDVAYLGEHDLVGDGDSRLVADVLGLEEAENYFRDLKTSVQWQKMYHRSGEVPRLVAVQGTMLEEGKTVPIYRHPADESPPLIPFDSRVDRLREACEEIVQHPLNHVLIQLYRGGEDNISEHSDKTLDIVQGSSIVNLSLGAMRTMTLRTKKASPSSPVTDHEPEADLKTRPGDLAGAERRTQRVRLPHNSAFVLGLTTNANWLHAVRADKRPEAEKLPDETAFGGERISLTFRNIGTFVSTETNTIYGQGARSKVKSEARPVLEPGSPEADRESEDMIIAFGKENHQSSSAFDWNTNYGGGYDVVNFVTKPHES